MDGSTSISYDVVGFIALANLDILLVAFGDPLPRFTPLFSESVFERLLQVYNLYGPRRPLILDP
ncbi:hypothetical protein OG21DRAFT_1515516 [Imleria badia]|nr:hypothetical protein OG21DRAFT_1515516 [Imleria badia]